MATLILALTTDALGIAVLGGALALAMLAQAGWWLAKGLRTRARAEGRVVATEIQGMHPAPIVEFVASDGDRHRFSAPGDGYLEVSQTVPVGYDRRAPESARVATYFSSTVRPVGLLVVAALVAAITLAMVREANTPQAADRVTAYLAFARSLEALEACAHRRCAPATTRRRLRAYDRDRGVVAPLASSPIAARIAAVQRDLRRVRRGEARPRGAPIVMLRAALTLDLGRRLSE